MDTYNHKYRKYKNKYLYLKSNQNGGTIAQFDLVEFIKNNDIDIIEKELLSKMTNQTYCDNILGRGTYGDVYVSQVGSTMDIVTSTKQKINMHIVVKKANEEGDIHVKIINKKLYIYGNLTIAIEAIILSYFNKLSQQKLSPHLPYMIGYSSCGSKNNTFVDKIITERHGLLKNIEVKLVDYDYMPLLWGSDEKIFKSNLGTLTDLMKYILLKRDQDKVVLSNGEKCDIVKLMDYLCISYIHTHNLLYKHNIIISDMYFNNIFIHWLNENSYMDNQYIGDTKYIYYKYNNKILKIKTYGIILKVGDVGTSIIMPRDDVMILGQAVDPEKNLHLLEQLTAPNYNIVSDFFMNVKYNLPFSIYKKTIAYKIYSMYPYSELVQHQPEDHKLLANYLTPNELLDIYDMYAVSKTDKNKTSLIIDEY